MAFSNTVVGGSTLVRNAIQSQDYVAGVSGWAIFRNGSAEFNNVTARGSLLVSSSSGASLHAYVNGANDPVLELTPEQIPGHTIDPAQVYALSFPGATDRAFLNVISPRMDGGNTAELDLFVAETGVASAGLTADEILISATGSNQITGAPLELISGSDTWPMVDGGLLAISVPAGAANLIVNNVAFTRSFANPPAVITTLDSGSGNFSRWTTRITNVTNTSFSVIIEKGATADANMSSTTGGGVRWVAVAL